MLRISTTALGLLTVGTLCATQIPVANQSEIANANPSPGDTLVMEAKTWTDQTLVIDFSGTESLPIHLLAEGQGQVILTGSSNLEISGEHVVIHGITFQECRPPGGADLVSFRSDGVKANHVRLTNCLFKDNNPTSVETGYKWVSLYGIENRVDHCWFEGKRHRGTTLVVWLDNLGPANYHRIDHNYFTRPVYTAGNNEAETIRIGTSTTSLTHSNTIVEYNFFEECDGEIESISNKSGGNIYRYNTFYNNGSILTLRHGHNCTVQGNYFFGADKSGGGGVRIIGAGHTVVNNYFQDLAGSGNLRAPIVIMGGVDGFGINDATNRYVAGQDATVAFNTIVNCKQGIYIGSDKSSSSETYNAPFNCTIAGNLIYNTTDPALEFEYDEIPSFDYADNFYFDTDLGKVSGEGFSHSDPLLTLGTDIAIGRIAANSPVIGAVAQNFGQTEDIDGDQRESTFDAGCDKYSADPPRRNPIQKDEVGPCWMSTVDCDEQEVVLPEDCAFVPGGSASVDDCGVCSGGTTGITPNGCNQCESAQASSDDGNVPANTLDLDPNTRWSAQGDGQFIEYCLETPINLAELQIAFYKGNERQTYFDVLVSEDGIAYDTVLKDMSSSGQSLDFETFVIPGSPSTWKIKIVGHGNSSSDWNSLTMVQWVADIFTSSPPKHEPLSWYLQPSTKQLIVSNSPQFKQFIIRNAAGRVVYTGNGAVIDHLSLAGWGKGVYLIQLYRRDGKLQHGKFMVL